MVVVEFALLTVSVPFAVLSAITAKVVVATGVVLCVVTVNVRLAGVQLDPLQVALVGLKPLVTPAGKGETSETVGVTVRLPLPFGLSVIV